MNFKRLPLLAFLFSTLFLNAEVDLEVSQGYARDRLDVSVSGPKGTPNIQSEFKFNRIDVYASQLRLTYQKWDYYLQGIAGYGNVYGGHVSSASYTANDRKGEQSSTRYHITGSYTADFSLTFGKHLRLPFQVTLTPHVGYGGYIQKFRIRQRLHTISDPFTGEVLSTTRNVKHINSRYKAHWHSPQIGLDFEKAFNDQISVYAKYNFLFPLKYHATGHLIVESTDTDQAFHDNAKPHKSFGNIAILGLEWNITDNCFVKAEYEFLDFIAKGGHRKQSGTRQPLHRAHRLAQEICLVLGYSF
jgi:opacity protein-like surface antigen